MQYTVWSRGEQVTFESDLSDKEAAEILGKDERPGEFVASLLDRYEKKRLTPKQHVWFIKLAQDRLNLVKAKPTYLPIVELLNRVPLEKFTVRFAGFWATKPPTLSRNAGCVYLLREEDRDYMGKILRDGKLVLFNRSPELVAALDAFVQNPVEYILRYGKETGHCSCCGRPLSDPVSVHAGIGPICLERVAGKAARKIMEQSFAEGTSLIQKLINAGVIETTREKSSEKPPDRGEFKSDHDFAIANALSRF